MRYKPKPLPRWRRRRIEQAMVDIAIDRACAAFHNYVNSMADVSQEQRLKSMEEAKKQTMVLFDGFWKKIAILETGTNGAN